MPTADSDEKLETTRRGGRPPAGTDPVKRTQILEGAGRAFSTLGFDAASMSDVAREAGVSKATLYVYYQDKEHLFAATCEERRERNISELIGLLDRDAPIAETLATFGKTGLLLVSQPNVVAAHRIVIGVAQRMPELGRELFEAGPQRLCTALSGYLEYHSARGALRVADPYLAAAQFLEMVQATIFRPRLLAVVNEAPTEDEIDKVVTSAVRVFLAAYAT